MTKNTQQVPHRLYERILVILWREYPAFYEGFCSNYPKFRKIRVVSVNDLKSQFKSQVNGSQFSHYK